MNGLKLFLLVTVAGITQESENRRTLKRTRGSCPRKIAAETCPLLRLSLGNCRRTLLFPAEENWLNHAMQIRDRFAPYRCRTLALVTGEQ